MSAEEFASKPKGQRLLVTNRLKDLIRTDRPELRIATAQVIALLTSRARFEGAKEYAPIVSAAFDWGFEKLYGTSWVGQPEIRESLIEAAKSANADAHKVLSKGFVAFVEQKDIGAQQRWYPHDLRLLVMALLANPACGDSEAESLAGFYDSINAATHEEY
jgi:hypothetical protein